MDIKLSSQLETFILCYSNENIVRIAVDRSLGESKVLARDSNWIASKSTVAFQLVIKGVLWRKRSKLLYLINTYNSI